MKKILLFLFCSIISFSTLLAEVIPLTLQARVAECKYVVLGEVVSTTSYWDTDHRNIYTLHEIKIEGYWKGHNGATHIGLVDLGGQVGMDMQETYPAVSLPVGSYGVFMLGADLPGSLQSTVINNSSPNFIQAFPTASIQGAVLIKNGYAQDPAMPDNLLTTSTFFGQLDAITNSELKTLLGDRLHYKMMPVFNPNKKHQTSKKTLAVTTLQNGSNVTTTIFNAGVSNNATMEMKINGSGFGTTAGTIVFPNADAGGAANTFVFPSAIPAQQSSFGAPSDIISWTNTQIRIRVPPNAGSGTIEVFNAANASQGTANITIDWALIAIYSTFSSFATETSQFLRLANDNSTGGYTFRMSSGGSSNFFTNAPAKAAFNKAMNTWRCGTLVNFELDLNAATAVGFANDGTNVVMFDNSLPSGVLGRATSRFSANSNGACNMHNTYWRIEEVDIQFQVIPSAGFTWNYNSGGTTSSQYSFETVSLHEIGHGHGLGHVVDVNKVMHYSMSNGTQNITLAGSDISAGQYKAQNSSSVPCIVTPGPMVLLVNPCGPLPHDLLSLTANEENVGNVITWVTKNEKNIVRYEVETSMDAMNFVSLGEVKAMPHQAEWTYNYLHENPQLSTNYYRLRIIDVAENVSYSKTVSVKRTDKNDFIIYPNPTNGDLHIGIPNLPLQSNQVQYTITDLNGRVWLSKEVTVNKKSARFTESLASLPSGMYFVQLYINGDFATQKIVKQ